MLLSAWAHQLAGLTLPIPWMDEPWLLWKSRALLDNGTLWAKELNPNRMVVNFPAYEALQAACLAVTGLALERLRWISWACTMFAFGFTLAWAWRMPLRWVSAGVACLFFLGSSMVAAGNIVRPDALIVALAAACLWLEQRGSRWIMASCAAVAAALHPAGFFVAAPIGLIWLWQLIRLPGWPDCKGWLAIGVAGVVWLALGIFVAAHWADVFRDYQLIYSGEGSSDPVGNLLRPGRAGWVALFAAAFALAAVLERRLLCALALALFFQILQIFRLEMWYSVHNQWSAALLWLAVPLLALAVLRRLTPARWTPLAAVLPVPFLLAFALRHSFVEGPRNYPRDMTWGWGMRAADAVPYATEADLDAVAEQLCARVGPGRSRVSFLPEGDALLLDGRLRGRVDLFLPIDTGVRPDWILWHRSRYIPGWALKGMERLVAEQGGERLLIRERDESEQWLLIKTRGPTATSST